MKKTGRILAIILILQLYTACGTKPAPEGHTPEGLFNSATEAMVKGDDAAAIDLYYKLVEDYPEFKKYRADALYRLGSLLFKTERYEESEKTLRLFAAKYPSDARVKKAYECLLHIYMQELLDEAKAKKIRDLYAQRFGGSPTLQDIDKTMQVLNADSSAGSEVLALDAAYLGIIGSKVSASPDREFFPVRNYVLKSVKSPDGRMLAEKKKSNADYAIYIGPVAGDKRVKIPGSSGGYAPQWSWDGRYVLFTSMDRANKARKIKIYDTRTNVTREIFKAGGVEPLVCISPDSSKVIFSYDSRLWIMNKNGNSVTLLSKTVNASGLKMAAWSRDGDRIIFSRKAEPQVFHICELGRREIEAIK
ncbi:MAG: tetratricopeptide repeat protein [Spirochaetia bacterium]|nr:tetratricopeptide repeat protein [Spirochaetia bacterium]